MAAPIAPVSPDIPSRSAPEADFDVKMFALFKWATDDFVSFMEAWRVYLETNSTIVGGALNETTIGQTTPVAGAFTELLAASLGGAAVQSSLGDTTAGKLLINGAHGLGGTTSCPNITDFTSTPPPAGFYRYLGGGGGAIGSPEPFGYWGSCVVSRGYDGDASFLCFRNQDPNNPPRAWAGSCQEDGSGLHWTEILTAASGNVTATFADLDVSGNAVIGTSSPWTFASSWRGIKLTARHALQATTGNSSVALSSNCAIGPSGWEYTFDAMAGNYTCTNGLHIFYRADAGAVGDPVGWIETARLDNNGHFLPGTDNAQNIGSASKRFGTIYAGSGTINTSDARSKEQVTDLDAAETRVAIAAKGLLKKYRFKEAVAVKGDKARWHFGVIAQDLAAAFEAEGLAAFDYGVMCWDEWWEADVQVPAVYVDKVVKQFDEEGNLLKVPITEEVLAEPARIERRTYESADDAPDDAERFDRYGVRYDELFAFILAAL